MYTMDYPDLTVLKFMEHSIGPKWVKEYKLTVL